MITKKIFVTTSSILLTVCLTACTSYKLSQSRFQVKTISLSAFSNLAANISSLSASSEQHTSVKDDSVVTSKMINIINKEINKKINGTRYVIGEYKKKPKPRVTNIIRIAKKEVQESYDDLSTYEINNKSMINLYALSIDQIAYNKFSSSKIVAINDYTIKDKVEVIQSSTKLSTKKEANANANANANAKPNVEIIKVADVTPVDKEIAVETKKEIILDESKDEEAIMFDYSKESRTAVVAKSIDQKLYERPLSNTVKTAITRELKKEKGNTQNVKTAPVATQEKSTNEIELSDEVEYEYSKNDNNKINESALNSFNSKEIENSEKLSTQFTIRAKEINLNTHKSKIAHSFEFIPDYERIERSDDKSNGEINLEYSLSGDMNIQTGVIQAQGVISTRVELNLGNSKGIEIPLLSEDGVQLFLQKMGISVEGNLILLALNNSIVNTDIDSKFAKQLFFDKDFKYLASGVDAKYVMYAGVKTGNILIRYFFNNNESAQKIIYVGEGEMYFEDSSFNKGDREAYSLTTRNILGSKSKELVIKGSDITFFNTNREAKKKAINVYEMKMPTLVSGMRKYLEFKHLKDSVFVGTSSEKKIEIPENNFITKVLEINQINNLKDQCLVQINLKKDIKEIKASGKNRSGEMLVETSFLDSDGEFSRYSELSKNAFLVGDMEGQFSVRLDYTDGTTEFLKTFCSEGTYLIEQL